jgi:DNA polymerase delta subunit 2
MPVHLLPGSLDPSGVILPQQPFPRAMFGSASNFSSFTCETNPTYLSITSASYDSSANRPSRPDEIERTFLVNSGQPLNDMWKYLPSPPATRLSLVEATLRWRHIAPTAPDTLWCHPYFSEDPFIIQETPDVYVIGDQPRLQTKLFVDTEEGKQKKCRIVLLPRFSETGVLVLVNLRTLGVKTTMFETVGMSGAVGHV